MSTDFNPYYKWLGIPPEEQPPHHYRLLAIKAFEEDPDVIEAAGDRLMAQLRTYQTGKHSAESQKLLNEVAAAKVCLLRPEKKADYDAQLRELLGRQSSGGDTSAQLEALRALDQTIADELARPLSQRREQTQEEPPWLALGVVVAVLIACIVAWTLFGRGKTQQVAKKAEGSSPPSAVSSQAEAVAAPGGTAGLPSSVAAPPQSLPKAEGSRPPPAVSSQAEAGAAQKVGVSAPQGHKSIAQGASPGKSSQEPQEQKAPQGRMESAAPPQSTAKAEVGSRQPAVGSQQKPNVQNPSPNPQSLPKAEEKPKPSTPDSSSPQPPTPNPQSRSPVPSVADQEKSKKEAQDLFRDDYAKAKKPSERAELARAILKKGVETRDPPADHFALLCLARDVAISADDDKLAYETIDEIAKSFEIEILSMKADALAAMSKSARPSATLHKTLCDRALRLGQEALDQDKLDVADALAKLSYSEAGKVRDKDLVQRSRVLAKGQQEAAKSYSAVQEAFKTLQEKPADPAANLAAGRYLCFSKGDWSKGLVHLAKSDDAKLKSLAEEDRKLTPPEWEPAPGVMPPDLPPPAAALKLADGWWDAGQAASGKQRDHVLLHASYWYHQSFGPNMAPLVAAKINTRLDQIDKIRRQYPSPPPALAPFDAKQAREHQRRWAEYLGLPVVMTNSIGMRFVLIPPGEFMMGSTEKWIAWALDDAAKRGDEWAVRCIRTEEPERRVGIGRPFYLGVYEVTQGEYAQVMGTNPSSFSAKGQDAGKVAGQNTGRHPVEMVSPEDSADFCRKLSAQPNERAARWTYRLPTEAEWECAARVGTTTNWSFGDQPATLGDHAWFGTGGSGTTHPAGEKQPNAWGLFDVYGNVWERCLDLHNQDYYQQSAPADSTRPPTGRAGVIRGGAWCYSAILCRSAYRGLPPKLRNDVGFRVATVR